MTLPASGQISMTNVNTELGLPATQKVALNDSLVRTMAQKPSGQIAMSDLWGKSKQPAGGRYVTGGPYNSGGYLMYGYSLNTIYGSFGSVDTPQVIGTGGQVITAVVSDGSTQFNLFHSGSVQPPGTSGKTVRVKNQYGVVLKDIPLSSLIWYNFSGIVGWMNNGGVSGCPNLAPVGTVFFVEII